MTEGVSDSSSAALHEGVSAESEASLGEEGRQELLLPNSGAKTKSALEGDLFVQCWRVMGRWG